MPLFDTDSLLTLALLAPPLLLSLTVHEFAHARTALAFGDPTAKDAGRVTLNPLAHLDPIGTLVLLLTQRFGWAKPVPVNPLNLHPRHLGDIAVSVAGPLSNLSLALVCAVALRAVVDWGLLPTDGVGRYTKGGILLCNLLLTFVVANVCLCVFNLIPLFPLDGHHVAREVLPGDMQVGFMHWQMRYGRFALMGIILVPLFVPARTLDAYPYLAPIRWLARTVQDWIWAWVF